MPGNGNVFHPEFLDGCLFMLAVSAAHVDYDSDSHLLQCFQTVGTRLASAVQARRDLAKIRKPHIMLAASHGTLRGRRRVLSRLSGCASDANQQQEERENP